MAICSVESNSAGIFVRKVSPGIFVITVKGMPIIFGGNIYITLCIYITKHYSITIHCLDI